MRLKNFIKSLEHGTDLLFPLHLEPRLRQLWVLKMGIKFHNVLLHHLGFCADDLGYSSLGHGSSSLIVGWVLVDIGTATLILSVSSTLSSLINCNAQPVKSRDKKEESCFS